VEENEEIFKVREKLKGLQTDTGFRLFMLYFTDVKVYLIETDSTSGLRNANRTAPIFFLFTKFKKPEKHFERFMEMDDTREIINATTWFRTWPYENVVSMWIEEGEDLNKLWFDIIQPDHRKKYFGDEDGEDFLWFDKKETMEFERVMTKMLGYKFHGFKRPD
jgi:hypothetical protein